MIIILDNMKRYIEPCNLGKADSIKLITHDTLLLVVKDGSREWML